jgi:hypothetical protein
MTVTGKDNYLFFIRNHWEIFSSSPNLEGCSTQFAQPLLYFHGHANCPKGVVPVIIKLTLCKVHVQLVLRCFNWCMSETYLDVIDGLGRHSKSYSRTSYP